MPSISVSHAMATQARLLVIDGCALWLEAMAMELPAGNFGRKRLEIAARQMRALAAAPAAPDAMPEFPAQDVIDAGCRAWSASGSGDPLRYRRPMLRAYSAMRRALYPNPFSVEHAGQPEGQPIAGDKETT
jgi:hypothetical protein